MRGARRTSDGMMTNPVACKDSNGQRVTAAIERWRYALI